MKRFKELLLTKPKKYKVKVEKTQCREEPYRTLELNKRIYVSHVVGYYKHGDILKVYDIVDKYARISRFRKRWVHLDDLMEV